jgi:hypothetical protein
MNNLISIADPRSRPNFRSRFFPNANGGPVPTTPANKNERIIVEFASAYYGINRHYAKLREIRKLPGSPGRLPKERAQMQEIEKALQLRDSLEDHYASYGVIVEPVTREGFAVDLQCSFGNVDKRGKPRALLVTLTASVPVPLPPGAKVEDYLIEAQMPELALSAE